MEKWISLLEGAGGGAGGLAVVVWLWKKLNIKAWFNKFWKHKTDLDKIKAQNQGGGSAEVAELHKANAEKYEAKYEDALKRIDTQNREISVLMAKVEGLQERCRKYIKEEPKLVMHSRGKDKKKA